MRITFINNNGGGFADTLSVAPGTTVSQLFAQECGENAEGYSIRVNRQAVARDYVLQEGDRVTITPLKIEGGA